MEFYLVVKEVREEAGLNFAPVRLIALQDRYRHNLPVYGHSVCKVFVLCEIIDGEFKANPETTESAFWNINDLPNLSREKNSEEQIKMCFDAYKSDNWNVIFD